MAQIGFEKDYFSSSPTTVRLGGQWVYPQTLPTPSSFLSAFLFSLKGQASRALQNCGQGSSIPPRPTLPMLILTWAFPVGLAPHPSTLGPAGYHPWLRTARKNPQEPTRLNQQPVCMSPAAVPQLHPAPRPAAGSWGSGDCYITQLPTVLCHCLLPHTHPPSPAACSPEPFVSQSLRLQQGFLQPFPNSSDLPVSSCSTRAGRAQSQSCNQPAAAAAVTASCV